MMVKEQDERNLFNRYHAGYRAFWIAIVLVYVVLMWFSMAANGSLLPIEKYLLWYIQAACYVKIPY